MNENIRALLLLCVVNVTGFCLLLRNCDFSVGSEKTAVGYRRLLNLYSVDQDDTVVEVLSLVTYTYIFRVI